MKVGPDPVCADVNASAVPQCEFPVACEGTLVQAAITICRTTRSIVVRSVTIANTLAVVSRNEQEFAVAGVAVLGAKDVRIEASTIVAAGEAVRVADVVEGGRSYPASATISGSQLLPLLAQVPPGQALAFSRPVLRVSDADVRLLDSAVDATGRQTAAIVDAREALATGMRQVFRMERSLVANATLLGLSASKVVVDLRDSQFLDNGRTSGALPAGRQAASLTGGAIHLASLDYSIVGNHIRFGGPGLVGVEIQSNHPGEVRENVFEQTGSQNVAILVGRGRDCSLRAWHNDLGPLRLVNDATACSVDARFNWWGRPEGPRPPAPEPAGVEGNALVEPWLRAPLAALPTVTIEQPKPGSRAYGKVDVSGTSIGPSDHPVIQVQASRAPDRWTEPAIATGTSPWTLTWDVTNEPLGPATLWLRACGRAECGVPVPLHVEVGGKPLPPIALLRAATRSVVVGEPVTLDATSSYSPQGWAVVRYRFDLGNGVVSDWTSEGTRTLSYDRVGTYTARVEVADEKGLASANPAEVLLRVRAPGTPDLEESLTPGATVEEGGVFALPRSQVPVPSTLPLIALALAAVLLALAPSARRRRRG